MYEKKREDRLDRTYRYAARARKEHLRVRHPDGTLDCECERAEWYFRKGKSLGCRCRRKKKGNPKVAGGMCSRGDIQPGTVERIAGHRLCRAWRDLVRRVDPIDVEL